MKKLKYIGCCLLAAGLVGSCIDEERTDSPDYDATVRVQLSSKRTNSAVFTRSFSEDIINDMHILVYNSGGKLTGHAYGSTNPLVVRALSGNNCSVYALTNTGNAFLFSGTSVSALSSLLGMTTATITSLDDMVQGGHLQMSGSIITDIVKGENEIVDGFLVSRLAAKNILHITCSDEVVLTGYSINDLPAKSWLIARPNANESVADDAAPGDDAVSVSNNGDWFDTGTIAVTGTGPFSITFYMYENRRGGRVPVEGTTGDPSTETAAEKPVKKAYYAPRRATYLELYVSMGGTSGTYRLYLGADNSGNYNVKRNCTYVYRISIGAAGILTVDGVTIHEWEEKDGGTVDVD
jgi:hypothetical protein